MSEVPGPTVQIEVTVDAPIDKAFAVFTQDMGSWWPPDHHIIEAELAEMVMEPMVGGNIYDRGTDGSECRWARVLVYDPPTRFAFSWDIDLQWQLESDIAKCSEVEVRFTPESPDRTRVELEHRHLDRLGDGWEGVASGIGGPEGWGKGLDRFAARVEGRSI